MLSRLARWYGTDVWGLAASAGSLAALAAFVAAWMIVDHGSAERAGIGAVGVGLLALPPLASRHLRPRALALTVNTLALTLSLGTVFCAIGDTLWPAYAIGLAFAVGVRIKFATYDIPIGRGRQHGAV